MQQMGQTWTNWTFDIEQQPFCVRNHIPRATKQDPRFLSDLGGYQDTNYTESKNTRI